MEVSKFDFYLPTRLIADAPANPRDHSRLLLVDRESGKLSDYVFYEIESMLGPDDVLILNETKVFPARLFANKTTGGKVELLFTEETKPGVWAVMTRPGLKIGDQISFNKHLFEVTSKEGMLAYIDTHLSKNQIMRILSKSGQTPLPPYINSSKKENKLRKEYQTVYAKRTGSAAAPTAGFHFTKKLLVKLKKKGVQIEYITLHVGLGTFAPVKTKRLEDHPMHFEYYQVDKKCAERLNKAKIKGKRIVGIGTTTTRVLETLAQKNGKLDINKLKGETNLFIYPPYKFRFIDALITNFHLPSSTLLALVSAFVCFPNTKTKFRDFGSSLMGKAYKKAIKEKYRFYSFGDACFIV